ncbi:putative myosin-binding protein [Dirofilaria immitis]
MKRQTKQGIKETVDFVSYIHIHRYIYESKSICTVCWFAFAFLKVYFPNETDVFCLLPVSLFPLTKRINCIFIEPLWK